VLRAASRDVREPGTPTDAVARLSQAGLTGSGSHRHSYGGLGRGHLHFRLHAA
jgi:hypothetical protein